MRDFIMILASVTPQRSHNFKSTTPEANRFHFLQRSHFPRCSPPEANYMRHSLCRRRFEKQLQFALLRSAPQKTQSISSTAARPPERVNMSEKFITIQRKFLHALTAGACLLIRKKGSDVTARFNYLAPAHGPPLLGSKVGY